MNNKLIIGVTGGIASGKSTFTSILQENGFHVISSDEIVKNVYKKGADGYSALLKLELGDILDTNGEIDKSKLRVFVFSDEKIKQKVEKAIHPIVINKIKDEIKNITDTTRFAVEIPLLFEAGVQNLCTHIVTIYATKEMMIQNVVARYNVDEKVAERILTSQMDIETKMKKSDFVIKNTGTIDDLRKKTLEFINKL